MNSYCLEVSAARGRRSIWDRNINNALLTFKGCDKRHTRISNKAILQKLKHKINIEQKKLKMKIPMSFLYIDTLSMLSSEQNNMWTILADGDVSNCVRLYPEVQDILLWNKCFVMFFRICAKKIFNFLSYCINYLG